MDGSKYSGSISTEVSSETVTKDTNVEKEIAHLDFSSTTLAGAANASTSVTPKTDDSATAVVKVPVSAPWTSTICPESSNARNSIATALIDENNAGPRHIPKVIFIEDVAEFVRKQSLELPLLFLQDLLNKFQFMELSLNAQKKAMLTKVPETKEALEAVRLLQRKQKAFKTRFVLTEHIYATAEIKPTETVFLWLGANVLLEYPLGEAVSLLEKNKAAAEDAVEELTSALKFLRKQQTTTEINISMIHNYGVQQRKSLNTETAA